MGCTPSRPSRAEADGRDRDDSLDASHSLHNHGASPAELLSEGSLLDQERMAAILQLSVSLSLLAMERGRTEAELCEAAVAARRTISAADKISIWRTRSQAGERRSSGSGSGAELGGKASEQRRSSSGSVATTLSGDFPTGGAFGDADAPGCLVCLASDAMGMQGRRLSLADERAPPCAALSGARCCPVCATPARALADAPWCLDSRAL